MVKQRNQREKERKKERKKKRKKERKKEGKLISILTIYSHVKAAEIMRASFFLVVHHFTFHQPSLYNLYKMFRPGHAVDLLSGWYNS